MIHCSLQDLPTAVMSTEHPSIDTRNVQHADDTDVVSVIEPETHPTHGAPMAASRQADELPDVANIPPNDRQPGNDAGDLTSNLSGDVHTSSKVE